MQEIGFSEAFPVTIAVAAGHVKILVSHISRRRSLSRQNTASPVQLAAAIVTRFSCPLLRQAHSV